MVANRPNRGISLIDHDHFQVFIDIQGRGKLKKPVSEPEIGSDESDFEEEVTDDEQDEQDTTERDKNQQVGSKRTIIEREANKKLESKKKSAKKYTTHKTN